MGINKTIYYFCLIFFLSCAVNESPDVALKTKLDEAKTLFNQGKYSKAKEQFEYIIYNNPGSSVALNAQYYFAESLYMLENYPA